MFFLFPDPHFKKTKHKWRIISPTLLAEYAYTLRVGGLVYTITDVEEVHLWMVKHFSEHPLFTRVPDEELVDDIIISRLGTCTEEGKKVQRNGGKNFLAVFRRVEDPNGDGLNNQEQRFNEPGEILQSHIRAAPFLPTGPNPPSNPLSLGSGL
ncbi:hypothetical protein INR49_009361 [Caranx melampygus]|nr:hypothetical protein INR49_009361 [Caranx melampygus]